MGRFKTNEIVADHGEWLEIELFTKKHPTAIMKIDRADWDALKVAGINRITPVSYHGGKIIYAKTKINGTQVRIHRLLIPDSKVVDHENHNGLDNRRSNIRFSTFQQNGRNRTVEESCKSGLKGVEKHRRKWRARIKTNNGNIRLGSFDTPEEAHEAYCVAAKKYFGEFWCAG